MTLRVKVVYNSTKPFHFRIGFIFLLRWSNFFIGRSESVVDRVAAAEIDTKNVLATKVASGVEKSVDASKKMASTLEAKRFLEGKNKNNGSIQL